jgi:hypothetical protein
MYKSYRFYTLLFMGFLICLAAIPLYAKDDKPPKEFGVYLVTNGGMKRLVPNVVFDENGLLYIESRNPPRFALKDIDHFVLYGKHDMQVLTLNPMLFMQASRLGKARYGFGKNVDFDARKRGNDLYTVKPRGLMGRGYFCLWINDTAWDFVIE